MADDGTAKGLSAIQLEETLGNISAVRLLLDHSRDVSEQMAERLGATVKIERELQGHDGKV